MAGKEDLTNDFYEQEFAHQVRKETRDDQQNKIKSNGQSRIAFYEC